ncbi:MAG: hypothetical protein HQL87_16285 [Magnetococcales bacterium]|nr:hypothetical protein [Magnetococcales bacterium]
MGELVIQDVDDAVIERLQSQAVAQHQSLEQWVREILVGAVRSARPTAKMMAKEELLAEMDRIRAMTPPTPPGVHWPTAEAMIREERDARADHLIAVADRIAAMGPGHIDGDVVASIREERERR